MTNPSKSSSPNSKPPFNVRAGLPKGDVTDDLEQFYDDVNLAIAAIGEIPISRLFEMRLLEFFFVGRERLIGRLKHLDLRIVKLSEKSILEASEPLLHASKQCWLKVRDLFVLPRTHLPETLVHAIIDARRAGLPSLKFWPDGSDATDQAGRDYFITHFIQTLPDLTMRDTWELPKYGVANAVHGILALAVLLGICTKPKPNGLVCNLRHFPGSGVPACIPASDSAPHACVLAFGEPEIDDPNCSLKSY
jgi:hypothetical protein